MEYQVGDFHQGNRYLDHLLGILCQVRPGPLEDGFLDLVIPMVVQITGTLDRLDTAEKTAQAVLSSTSSTPERAQCARVGLAVLAVQRDDAASAAELYAHLGSSQGRMTRAGTVTIDRVLGLLAKTMGQLDLAVNHFEDALAFCRGAGYRPELAWTCYHYATVLRQRHQDKRAASFLGEALSLCTELGMRPLLERVNRFCETIEAQPPKGPRHPAGLTERQIQVLRLIAEGKTSREIAEELLLSERTVQRHISGIYAKIGARNRTDATVFALSQLALVD